MAKGLNKKGILQLADDLIAHRKRYDQGCWGSVRTKDQGNKPSECGTFACMAGFCHIRKIGIRKFNQKARTNQNIVSYHVVPSGVEQLGIDWDLAKLEGYEVPQIFSSEESWPDDLHDEMDETPTKDQYIVALKALQRLLPNGDIDPDPKAVHTRIPQLKAILFGADGAAKIRSALAKAVKP